MNDETQKPEECSTEEKISEIINKIESAAEHAGTLDNGALLNIALKLAKLVQVMHFDTLELFETLDILAETPTEPEPEPAKSAPKSKKAA